MIKIVELEPAASVQRELLLVKVRADLQTRSHVLETAQLFRAKVVDVARGRRDDRGHRQRSEKLEALLRVLEPFGIRELVQSGMVAVGRGSRSITDRCPTQRLNCWARGAPAPNCLVAGAPLVPNKVRRDPPQSGTLRGWFPFLGR